MSRRKASQTFKPPRVRYSRPPGSESTQLAAGQERKSSEYDEVKSVALNLIRSPEKFTVWESADPFIPGAGQAASAEMTSAKLTPRGLRRHRAVQRQASNQASDEQGALGESPAMEVPEYLAQCKKRTRDGRVASDGDRCTAMV